MSRVIEHMDLVYDGESLIAKQEEDRISKLPEDIIHHILGFLDMKHAIQTSKLSRKWRRIWTSMPHLNFNSELFPTKQKFGYFVKLALSRRTIHSKVSAVKLTFTGAPTVTVKNIVNYAYSHNVTEMNIVWFITESFELPWYLFSSNTLKHLTVVVGNPSSYPPFGNSCLLPESAWDFPALETLSLKDTRFRFSAGVSSKNLNLFSKCVKLKDLTLHNFSFIDVNIFNICAPQLSNLTITNVFYFPEVFNVVAPKLQNLQASINCENGEPFSDVLHFSAESFSSLERANLSLFLTSFSRYTKESCVPGLLDLFQKLHSAKYLILDLDIIEILSSSLDQLSHQPCPFNNLKTVKIDTVLMEEDGRMQSSIASIPDQVRNYFLAKSPCATFVMDYPQLRQKRSRQQVYNDTTPKKIARLEAEKKQPEPLAEEKRTFETKVPMQDEVTAKEKAKTQMHDEVISKQKAMFEAKLQMQDEVISKQKAMFETKLQMQNEVIAEHKTKLQIQDEVITKQESMLEAAKSQHENLTSLIITCKIKELRVQVESGNPDYKFIRSVGNDIKSVMSMVPESLRVVVEADFSFQYVELKSLFFTHIDASQWAKIETELGYTRDSDTNRLKAIHSESHVPAAKLLPAPKPSSSNLQCHIATSSSVVKSESKVVWPPKSTWK